MDHLRDSKGKAKKQTTWHSKRRTTSRIDARSSSHPSDDIANLHSINLIAAKWNTNIDPIHSIHGPPDQIQMSLLSVQYIHSNSLSIPIPMAYPQQRSMSLAFACIAAQDTQIKYQGPCSRRNLSNSLFSVSSSFERSPCDCHLMQRELDRRN